MAQQMAVYRKLLKMSQARFTRAVLFIASAAFVLSVKTSWAQNSVSLANLLDTHAAANGLPTGNGVVDAPEQTLASALINDITSYDQALSSLAQASPEDSAWAANFEQNVQQYDQRMAAAGSSFDARAEVISDAVAQFGEELENTVLYGPLDPRAQALSDAVAQYGNDTPAQPPMDPRAQALSEAVAQYGAYVDSLAAERPLDPRAQALSDAVAQYSAYVDRLNADPRARALSDAIDEYAAYVERLKNGTLTDEDRQRMENSVQDSAEEYIDQSDVQNKEAVKRRINRLVQFEIPSQSLPINGYWRVRPFAMHSAGECDDNGDNGGMAPEDVERDPGQPLCGYALEGMLPFIVWQGSDHPYLPGTGSIYSRATESYTSALRDSNGATIGSMRRSTTTEYRVVAPDLIQVHLLIQDSTGCTRSATYMLELVTADESVCPAMVSIPVSTPAPVSTPVATPEAGTPEPTEEPQQVMRGLYRISSREEMVPEECTDTNTPPEFDELQIERQPDGNVQMIYGAAAGTTTQILYADGDNTYVYDTGFRAEQQFNINLSFDETGLGSLLWSVRTSEGQNCFVIIEMTPPGYVAPEPTATASTNTSGDMGEIDLSDIEMPAPVEGTFTVTWSPIPGLDCDPALRDLAPSFTQATVTASGSSYVVEGGDQTYELTDFSGMYSYMQFNDDGSGEVLGVSSLTDDGGMILGYNTYTASGAMCILQATFTPQ